MTSTKTQLPYDYYDIAVHCKPLNGTKYKSENLGEILRGDRIVNTRYKVNQQNLFFCFFMIIFIRLQWIRMLIVVHFAVISN